jgi:molecular chaperone DnaJ
VIKGSNLRVRFKLTLEEVAHGAEKQLRISKLVRAKGSEYAPVPPARAPGRSRACRAPSWATCKR